MEEAKHICVYSGSAHPELSQQIANYLGISLGKVHLTHFPDGEYFVQFEENVRRADAFLIQPTCKPPNDNLMELLIMIDAARRASAARITAVLPYFGYARQDRKDKPRVPITAKLVANLITEAGADRIITMDLHSQQIQGFFDIPMDHLYARPVLVPYLKKLIGTDGVVVAPDSGSAKMAMNYGDMLEAGFAVVTKRRINATTVASSHLVGDVKDKICVITDDLTSTAGTLCAAAKILKANGAKKVYAAVSHCMLNDSGKEKLLATPEIEQLVTTDAVPVIDDLGGRIKVISVAPLLGEAIRRIHDGKSVSSLFYINH
ncbi:ribose-phosphate pyrophosphokinase [uncultured Victivallis sp.]|uniref:ribose-phosphate diphosphokinase n=1 Tax=uncultured Victivallis sp. TaxID=354118 RepID=UPI0025DD60D2|nr:ribose-phosphate pyrophosphokinase [uncultured Victivallis sp.]